MKYFYRTFLLLLANNFALHFSNICSIFKGESGDDGHVGAEGREVNRLNDNLQQYRFINRIRK
jgi:hypothetical protein